MLKEVLNAVIIEKKFQLEMKNLQKSLPKTKLYKVKITEEQIAILRYCAIWGIKDVSTLS